VLVVMPALLVRSGAMLAAAPGAAEAAPHPAPARTVVVAPGESLWAIATRIAPHADPRDTVAAIERANGLRGAEVPAGAVLRLPVR
jgi:Tfp pilus assembly protein FimV